MSIIMRVAWYSRENLGMENLGATYYSQRDLGEVTLSHFFLCNVGKMLSAFLDGRDAVRLKKTAVWKQFLLLSL